MAKFCTAVFAKMPEIAGTTGKTALRLRCMTRNRTYGGKSEEGSKIFFRYYHHLNLHDKEQAFSQLQLGASVNLTDIWGQKD